MTGINNRKSIPAAVSAGISERPLRFSFKHLDIKSQKFSPTKCCNEYFQKLFCSLQKFSTWKVSDFTDQNNNEHRHIINFSETSEPEGFESAFELDRDQAGYAEGWQFSVDQDQPWSDWRVQGVLIDEVFYVVWLDSEHALYNRRALPPGN